MISEDMHAQLNQYVEQQQLLLTVTHQIASSIGLNETIPHILDGVFRATEADSVRLLLAEPNESWLSYATGPLADVMASSDSQVLDLLGENDQIEVSRDDTPEVFAAQNFPAELITVIALPLTAHQAHHGVLWLGFCSSHTVGQAERTFLFILAGQAAIAIANAQAYEAARRRREWLAAVLASTPDPVLVVDRNMCLQLVNPAASEMFGTSADNVIGQPIQGVMQQPELAALLENDNPIAAQRMLEYTAENGRTYSPSISDVRTEDGEMTGYVLVLRDISHFKRLNDNMSDFLSTVSHDMRSPLTFMKGYLDMLGMVGDLNERQTTFVEKIATGVIQMSDMVEKILEAGKLDPMTGTYELNREPCDVVDIVQKMVSGLQSPAEKKGLTLTTTIEEGIPVINADRALLASAFTNLAENAVKYTPDGGRVHVKIGLNSDVLIFKVADNGLGISPEDQKKLFKRNVRIRRKEWKRVKGSGLGLFIVKNIAQRHGGDVWIESVENEGSTFYLSIPLEGQNLLGGESAMS
ncbi:MAG: PAS domain S-box protein [Anaerolineae bacterium]|nr:PAS domain S-box protein [Anaerolineae bacterium]